MKKNPDFILQFNHPSTSHKSYLYQVATLYKMEVENPTNFFNQAFLGFYLLLLAAALAFLIYN